MAVSTVFEIEVAARKNTGSPASRGLRRNGRVPANIYARGESAISTAVSEREFVRLASQAKVSQVFTLKSTEVPALNGRLAVVKEVQTDYIKNKVLHVDFQALHDNEEIHVHVPIRVAGEAPGVKAQGGILTVVSRELEVSCLPRAIPNEVQVDISELMLGQSIHAKQISLPEGVKLYGNPDETIVAVVAVRAVAEEAVVAPTAAATPEEAAKAGAAPAAAGKAAPAAKAAPAKDAKK